MPSITIDGQRIKLPQGATILDAAAALGIDVPTLCFVPGFEASTSCLVCVVKLRGTDRFVPACATKAIDGMEIDSDTPEVYAVRRNALELLLSDHTGDCFAPCHFACPAHMDVPLMLRQITASHLDDAIRTIKADIAFPAVLGRVCPAPCEKGCRRAAGDGPVAVCQLKRYAADEDLKADSPYRPDLPEPTGRRVAVIGGGPTGLSAAYYLRRAGHEVALYDDGPQLGGRLHSEVVEGRLPQDVLDAEVAQIVRLQPVVQQSTTVTTSDADRATRDDATSIAFNALRDQHDAVLIAWGTVDLDIPRRLGLRLSPRGIAVEKASFATSLRGVFAAGGAIRNRGLVVRSVADGKEAAGAIDHFLTTGTQVEEAKKFTVKTGKLDAESVRPWIEHASSAALQQPAGDDDYSLPEAVAQASRCLQCGCTAPEACRLKQYAELYDADPNRFRYEKTRSFRRYDDHPLITYEPGKCIDCGLCLDVARAAGEPVGLSFVGRGFEMRIGVPWGESLSAGLQKAALKAAATCPTSALSVRDVSAKSELPILG